MIDEASRGAQHLVRTEALSEDGEGGDSGGVRDGVAGEQPRHGWHAPLLRARRPELRRNLAQRLRGTVVAVYYRCVSPMCITDEFELFVCQE